MKFILSVFIVLSLTACASLLPKGPPAPALYTLSPAPLGGAQDQSTLNTGLRVLMPQASPGLETEKIALRKKDNQLDYYAGAGWAGSLGTLVQTQMVQYFDNTHQLASVTNDLVAVNQDYSLLIEIHDFQAEYRDKPLAHVRLTAKLIRDEDNRIIVTRSYDQSEVVKSETLQNVVIALNAAYERAASAVVADTLQTLRQQPQPMAIKPMTNPKKKPVKTVE